eukprot:CAMPEP_0113533926 /NCGR_PEP_ID=MMETSP0015_2-20120614/4883_1 /TAXON_ID=2838 /ORGANISM="Odontella" /LENGTH=53 /DNA_ID=CAMNT_0000433047 /DNA_START=1 /DNA_END=159 /DNA_ORIENTATION=+ /assembly_acc=CAM_ASM_000160
MSVMHNGFLRTMKANYRINAGDISVIHGFLRTMKANYRINAGDISVIRPLVYC